MTRRHKILLLTALYVAQGLPYGFFTQALPVLLRDAGYSLKAISATSLLFLPWALKFLWAPLVDRFTLPLFGRRRGWMLVTQLCLVLALIGLGLTDPARSPWVVAGAAFLVTFLSASQDIVIDAYRREDLRDNELGLGSSLYVNGYRLGMLLAGSGGLILADHFSFAQVYLMMAATLLVGVVTTLSCREPALTRGTPRTFREAVVEPFVEYFSRDHALALLLFILLYKLGDAMAAHMTTPFYLDVGFTKTEIGAVVKLFGFWATVAGGLVGGVVILRLGIVRALWGFGILQGLSTAAFVLLALAGPDLRVLTAVIAFENLSSGLGTSAYVAFMATLTNRRFTATQYAQLSSLMGVPRVLAAAPTGWLAEQLGWATFFVCCALAALPGLWVLARLQRRGALPRHAEAVA